MQTPAQSVRFVAVDDSRWFVITARAGAAGNVKEYIDFRWPGKISYQWGSISEKPALGFCSLMIRTAPDASAIQQIQSIDKVISVVQQ